jgi:SulP family sulfate permease
MDIRSVGDMGALPSTLPMFLLPQIPLTWETLFIVLPYSLTLATVGLLESLMTASIIDDLTDTPSDKNRECSGQGIGNIVAGFFGGMAGCAMIGQSVINVKSGGRGRLSTLFAGIFLLFLIVVLGPWVKQIPMAALVAVMIMVSIGTFSWSSLKNLRTYPKSSNIVMLSTVAVVVATHDLAKGVFVGVLLSSLFFAVKVSRLLSVTSKLQAREAHRLYTVQGQVFFVSADQFLKAFDFKEVLDSVTIDLYKAHFWDISAVGALDKVILKFRREGTTVELLGLNEASSTIIDRLGQHNDPEALHALDQH